MADGGLREPAPVGWGWTAHERAQRGRYANLPLAAKIAWLEEAQRLVLVLQQQRRQVVDQPVDDQAED